MSKLFLWLWLAREESPEPYQPGFLELSPIPDLCGLWGVTRMPPLAS